ncbi:MAG TPA: alpha/beta hydrolase-fold protein [Candidatus Acidoferrales bacterium]|nr:alpha/beta hydrolase-fold protein [Candidatus Acidoferrales bacterium]
MKNDFRFTYSFLVDRPPGQRGVAQIDPLNSHKMAISFENADVPVQSLSIASMPQAPSERWLIPHPDAPKGKVTLNTLPSMSLGTDRKVWVYTPPQYDPRASEPYELLILFDGYSYVHWIPAPTIFDNLIDAHLLPPTVAVLIDNPPESRSSDLHVSPAFLRFLTTELMPWLREHFNVTHDPTKTIIGGYSLGGLAAAFTAMQRPDLFGNVLSQSGSFWEGNGNIKWEFLASKFQSSPRLPIRFFMEAGLLEDVSDEGPTLLAANRHLAAILKEKGYSVTYQEVGGTHEPVHWRDTLPQGLTALAK